MKPNKYDLKGKQSWSLVNKKCEPDYQKIFDESWTKLIDSYKKQIEKVLDPNFYEMWLNNQKMETVVTGLAFAKCYKEVYIDDEVKRQHYAQEVKKCYYESLKDTVNEEGSGYVGTMTGAKKGVELNIEKLAVKSPAMLNCMKLKAS
jgi:hypothetical protein